MDWLLLLEARELETGTREAALNDLTGITRFIYEVSPSNEVAGYIVFGAVFLLCAIVYKLGFARSKLKLWQNLIVYGCLFLGCIVLTFLALALPMIEGLIVAVLILAIYKGRLKFEKSDAES
ncbi:hypothetical protein GCM10007425_13960 [Lysinibacillus alkalisoli]|uniref:YlaH-like protein n=1 Tax=Lysinibacillus alkalisoli TaxID=1911548 RepID=A0A917G342_9BACI|nr:hypothetical protein GCM10007425_13960 [Lysinibacillus alkalisoli]